MIVYDKEQKQIVIPNGLGNVNIIINQGCDDDKPTPPQDGWGMTGIFNNWGESPDIPFKENGEWDGRPYKVIRNFGATGGEFKIRRNNAWTDSYTASFHNEPQFAKLLKNDFSMSIDDGVWDIYLFFGNDGEPNEMLILRPGTDLSTIKYEYTLTIATDKENAIIEIADSYRGMTDRYYGSVTVTMKYGCIYYINVYLEGYEDISDEITCRNDEERNYTLTKYNTIADIYGSPSDSTVKFKGLVALSFKYSNRGDYILFTDHTGSIVLKNCQVPLKVGDECLVTATLRRFDGVYISVLFDPSIEVLSSNNYVVMPTDAVELTNLNDLYIPNEDGYAEMKYLYADGTVVQTPLLNFMRIQTDATKPDSIALRGDFSDWEGKLAEGDNIRVYMFTESSQNVFFVTDIIELGEEDGSYDKGQADLVAKARVLDVTENGNYLSKYSDPIVPDTYTVTGVYADGTDFYSYAELNRKVFDTKIAATIDSRLEFWYKGDNTSVGFGDNVIIGAGNNDDNNCFQARYHSGFNSWVRISVGDSSIDINNWSDTVWHHLIISKAEGLWVDGEKKGDFSPTTTINGEFFINGIGYDVIVDGLKNANGTFGMVKIDDIVFIPTANGFQNVNTGKLLKVVKNGTYTFTENLPIYGEGELYKTINVNIDVDSYYNNGYNQGKTDGVNEQKSKLESISITENGTYTKEDGYSHIEVNVPDLNGSYDEGYAEGERVGYGQGKTDGINEQKGKLTQLTISENGTYTKEDGYREVVVNVPDLNGSYDEGYNQGKIDGANEQKSKLETINITENGTYTKEDGYREVVVNVPDLNGSYDEGYNQGKIDGVNEQKSKLESISITENGTYTKEDGYNHIEVNVIPKIDVEEVGLKFSYSTFTELPEYFDFKNVTNMYEMFANCTNLQTIPLIDTSNVTTMERMFYECTNLQTIPLIDTSNVTTMERMFCNCYSLQTLPEIDTSNVTNMYSMFYNVYGIDTLVSLPKFNCRKVTRMNYYFSYYNPMSALTDVGGWENLKCKWNDSYGLYKCPNLTYQSCINVLNGLYDFVAAGETPDSDQGQLKVAQSFIDKVGDEISIGTAKGWTITA